MAREGNNNGVKRQSAEWEKTLARDSPPGQDFKSGRAEEPSIHVIGEQTNCSDLDHLIVARSLPHSLDGFAF